MSVRRAVDRSTSLLVSAIWPDADIREPVTASEYGLVTGWRWAETAGPTVIR
jgi:hypothetical protein